jgi:hypothetical protein
MSTTITPLHSADLLYLGHHLATHILSQLKHALNLSTRIATKTALFTKDSFRAASNTPHNELHDAIELTVYDYASLYESIGKKLTTPWNASAHSLACFGVLGD